MIRAGSLAALIVLTLPSPGGAMDMAIAKGAQVRVLDKLTGQLSDVDLATGESQNFGKLTVQVNECRYPADNQTAEAEVHLTVLDSAVAEPVFRGWMIASSPALSALDHPRYDVWVMRCDVPQLALPEVEPLPEDAPAEGAGATDAGTGQ